MKNNDEKVVSALLVPAITMPVWLQDKEEKHLGVPMPTDEAKMEFVISVAEENVRRGTGGPFGAAIFNIAADTLIAVGVNCVVPANQSWAHAEMIAFAHAQTRLKTFFLRGCMLVTSCEPCAMCCGATPWSGVDVMIYGATKAMAEAVGFDEGDKGECWKESLHKRNIIVRGPMLPDRAAEPFSLYAQKGCIIY